MRLTRNYDKQYGYELKCDNPNTSINQDISNAIQKLGQLEDIEDVLRETCFYGYVVDHGIQKIKFVRIYQGHDYELDIRIEFELVSGLGNVFYNIFDYGKTWALTKEELIDGK